MYRNPTLQYGNPLATTQKHPRNHIATSYNSPKYPSIMAVNHRQSFIKSKNLVTSAIRPGRHTWCQFLRGVVTKAINLSLAHSKSEEMMMDSEMRESNINVSTKSWWAQFTKYLSKSIYSLISQLFLQASNETEWRGNGRLSLTPAEGFRRDLKSKVTFMSLLYTLN